MTDYTKPTGSSGTMMLRVNATTVQFFLKSASGTFNHDLPWGYTVNSSTDNSNSVDYVGNGSYILIATFTVTTSQTVTYRLMDSGTSGIGGPTTLAVAVDRAGAPPAPTTPVLSQVDQDSVLADTASNGNNGDALDLIQIGFGTSSSTPLIVRTANLTTGQLVCTGLAKGTWYYFWARVHNSYGYSPYSGRSSAKTWDLPPACSIPVLSNPTMSTVDTKFGSGGTGGGTSQPANTGYELGYGTSATAPTTIISSPGTLTVTGLTPGTMYYFWARAKNSVGTGPWSGASSIKTVAGAQVYSGGAWHQAVPYVKVAGVWKPARPWAKQGGIWRESG